MPNHQVISCSSDRPEPVETSPQPCCKPPSSPTPPRGTEAQGWIHRCFSTTAKQTWPIPTWLIMQFRASGKLCSFLQPPRHSGQCWHPSIEPQVSWFQEETFSCRFAAWLSLLWRRDISFKQSSLSNLLPTKSQLYAASLPGSKVPLGLAENLWVTPLLETQKKGEKAACDVALQATYTHI